jgi:hypothetical protein
MPEGESGGRSNDMLPTQCEIFGELELLMEEGIKISKETNT